MRRVAAERAGTDAACRYREDPASGGAPLSSAQDGDRYYIAQIHGLRLYNLSTLYVDYRHVMHHGNGVLAEAVAEDYYRYLPYLTQALHNLIARYERQYFQEHRQSSAAGAAPDEAVSGKTANQQTDKVFALAFYNLPVVARVRQLRTASIGKLLSISGTVTRTSEVRPELAMATFVCDNCSTVVPNVEQAFRYTEPAQCPNLTCANRHGWRLDIRQSTFVDWQKNRIQENSAEIPTGSMPRTIDVIFRGEMVDRAKAGEKCLFTGTLIVVPDVSQFRMPGVRAQASREGKNAPRGTGDVGSGAAGVGGMRELGVRDLTYRLAFLACMVTPDTTTAGQSSRQQLQGQADNILSSLNQVTAAEAEGNSEELQAEYLATLSAAEIEDLRSMVQKPDIFMRLVDSVAPMVYGHQVIKKGLLLQLMGGVSKVTPEGMSLRGDINICIVGDPSTSKSQFLK